MLFLLLEYQVRECINFAFQDKLNVGMNAVLLFQKGDIVRTSSTNQSRSFGLTLATALALTENVANSLTTAEVKEKLIAAICLFL